MHGCEAGANRGKGGERESVHVELFFQSRVQVCLKNLGFLGGARAPLLFIPLSLSLSLERVKKKRGKTWTTSWTFVPLSSNRSKKREYDRRSTGIWTKKEKLKFPSKVSSFFPLSSFFSPSFGLL